VLSHIRIGTQPDAVRSARLDAGSADLLLATDLVVGAHPETLFRLDRERTRAVLNQQVAPTAGQVLDPHLALDAEALVQRVEAAVQPGQAALLDARLLAERLTGDGVGANLLLLGYAFQKGWLPVSLDALQQAIRLNGAGVERNLAAFGWGRQAAHDLPGVLRQAGLADAPGTPGEEPLAERITRRAQHLEAYQDRALAERYRARVAAVAAHEQALDGAATALTAAVADGLHRVLAVKDEYEVARLHAASGFLETLAARFGRDARPRFHFTLPGLPGRRGARPKKHVFGAWSIPLLQLLSRLRRLRGTPFDPFALQRERRRERAFAARYEVLIDTLLPALNDANADVAVELLALPAKVRGFGPVKLKALDAAEAEMAALLEKFHAREPERRAA
jgi:indolepyruvate ferredoxin oxidoreductase